MTNVCFACGQELEYIYPAREGEPPFTYGTHFSATGNYGSGVFDPSDRRTSLRLTVCDDCMHIYRERIIMITTTRPAPTYQCRAWTPPTAEDEE
jgi:hypothetical protein